MSSPVCKICEQSSGGITDLLLCRGNCRHYLHYYCASITEERFQDMPSKMKRKWRCKDCKVNKTLKSSGTENLNSGKDSGNSLSPDIVSVAVGIDNQNSDLLINSPETENSNSEKDSGNSLFSDTESAADGIDNQNGDLRMNSPEIKHLNSEKDSGNALPSDIGSVEDSVANQNDNLRVNSPENLNSENDSGNSLPSYVESFSNGIVNQNGDIPNTVHELNAIREKLTQTERSLEELRTENNQLLLRLTDFELQMRDQEATLNKISVGVRDTNRTVYILDQDSKNRLEIHGLHIGVILSNDFREFEDEIKRKIVEVGRCFGVEFSVEDIDKVDILKSEKNFKQPILLVHFFSEGLRDILLAMRKKVVKNADLPGGSGEKRIYINENLNPYYKSLWYQTRGVARDEGFKFVWFSEGKLYIRKNKYSPKIRITCKEDLDELKTR